MSFASLGLSTPLVDAARLFPAPTPVQAAVIPVLLRGADVLATAQTGSGKTLAYVLPLLQRLRHTGERQRRTQLLVLVPTRELAAQVTETMLHSALCLPQRIKVVSAIGGVSINPQMMALRGGAEVVVATPGRLLDLVEKNALQLRDVTALVLDEADRLLDLGFAQELTRVLALLPPRRQSVLLSATFPPAVEAFANTLLHKPVRIAITETPAELPVIQQRAIEVDAARRTQLLRHLIQTEKWSRVLVFVARQYTAELVAEKLRRSSISALAFHGELSQGARTQALADFKGQQVRVLVATDLAGRGLDIVQLPVVVNYDLPRSAVDYTHRIGRTGRAGEPGLAVSFITAESHAHFCLIEKRHHLRLTREHIAGFEPQDTPPPSPGTGGIKGRRKSKKDKLREAAARKVR